MHALWAKRAPIFKLGLAPSIVAANFGLFLLISVLNGATPTEARLVAASLQLWNTGSFEVAHDVPPLARAFAVVPLLFQGTQARTDATLESSFGDHDRYESRLVEDFAAVYGSQLQNMIWSARLMGFVWWGLGAWILFRWCRELYGLRAARFGLILWGFGPNLLAREGLATPDLPAAVSCLAATYLFRGWLKAPSLSSALLAGVSLGIAQLVDFSAIVLLMIWPIFCIFGVRLRRAVQCPDAQPNHLNRVAEPSRAHSIFSLLGGMTVILVAAIWIINLGYLGSRSGLSLGELQFESRLLKGEANSVEASDVERGPSHINRFRESRLGGLIIPLPAAYLEGLDRKLHDSEGDSPVISLHYSQPDPIDWNVTDRGFLSFTSLLEKTPVAIWLMLAGSLAMLLLRPEMRSSVLDEALIWGFLSAVPLTVVVGFGFLFAACGWLIAAPFAILAMSRLGDVLRPGARKPRWAVTILLAWFLVSGLTSMPHPLGYVNEVARVSNEIRGKVVHVPAGDSGQDMIALIDWLKGHSETGLACCFVTNPRAHGVRYTSPPVNPGPWLEDYEWFSPRRIGPYPGYFALDLYHLALPQYAYFLKFEPILSVGPSIRIYHIAPEHADRIRREQGLPDLGDEAALKRWLADNPEARPIELNCEYVIQDPKSFGIGKDYLQPPPGPGPSAARSFEEMPPVGPVAGYFAVDAHALTTDRYRYFQRFRPLAKVGSSISIYKIELAEAHRERRNLGLPMLVAQDRYDGDGRATRFLHRDFRNPDSQYETRYSISVPRGYTREKPYPLIVFLHGYGDAFDDPNRPGERKYLTVGLPMLLERRQDHFGFIVLCPNSRSGGWDANGGDTENAMAILDRVVNEFSVDKRRIYLTGLSSGGSGVWDIAARYPDRWAAIAPVATAACDPAQALSIKDIPCWCFHNRGDRGSTPEIPRKMIKALFDAGGAPRYTEFPDLKGHDAWNPAYGMDEFYEWLLSQSK